MKRALILGFSVLTLSLPLFADMNSEDNKDFATKVKEGKLMTVTLTVGNPLKFFVAGKEEARLDLKNMKLKVRRLAPYPGEELKVSQDGQFYTVQNSKIQPREIEVTATVNESRETFQFDLNNDNTQVKTKKKP